MQSVIRKGLICLMLAVIMLISFAAPASADGGPVVEEATTHMAAYGRPWLRLVRRPRHIAGPRSE